MEEAIKKDEAIKKLQKEQLVTLDDASIVVHNHNGKVKVKQAVNLVGAGILFGGHFPKKGA